MHAALRNRLRSATGRSSTPRKTTEAAIRRLGEQLERARRLFEFGEYDWKTFCARRADIREQQRQLTEAVAQPEAIDLQWCETQLLDLVSAWQAADPGQRSRLVAGIFDHLETEALPDGRIRVVGVPHEA
jgi:hypothetical protein